MSNEYLGKIKKIIEDKAGVSPSEVHENSFFEEDLNIGEMDLLEILSELEEIYKVDLVSGQDDIETVQDLMELIAEQVD